MLKRIITIIKDKSGAGAVQTAAIFLAIMLVISVIMEYSSVTASIRQTKDAAQRSLDSLLIKNATDIFSSIKNGRSSVYDDQTEELEKIGINEAAFLSNLAEEMGLGENSDGYYRGKDDSSIFVIMKEEGFKIDTSKVDKMKIHADFYLGKDFAFLGKKIFNIKIPISTESLYSRKNDVAAGKEPITQQQDISGLWGNEGAAAVEKDLPTPSTTRSTQVSDPHGGTISVGN